MPVASKIWSLTVLVRHQELGLFQASRHFYHTQKWQPFFVVASDCFVRMTFPGFVMTCAIPALACISETHD